MEISFMGNMFKMEERLREVLDPKSPEQEEVKALVILILMEIIIRQLNPIIMKIIMH
jgi:hypothetical protein